MTQPPTLRTLARAFLRNTEPLAWEGEHYKRSVAVLAALERRELDHGEVRAALATESPNRAVRPAKGIAFLSLTGVLWPHENLFTFFGGTAVAGFLHNLTAAAADPAITAILIYCDSPGGSVRLIPETAAAVRAARTQKPVVVAVGGLCASAAYWALSGATRIDATVSADVGSIGVCCQRVSIAKRLEQEGVDVATIHAGKYKVEGLPEVPMTPEETTHLQRRVDETYRQMVGDIAVGRGTSAAQVRGARYGEGRCLTATAALEAGMIDAIATPGETAAIAGQPTRVEPPRLAQARASLAPFRRRQQEAALMMQRAALARVTQRYA